MKTQGTQLRATMRADASGLLFLQVMEPRALLTFKLDSDDLRENIAEGIRGLFMATRQVNVNVLLLGQEGNDLIWSVSTTFGHSSAFERTLQVA